MTTKYNHAYTFAFSIESITESGEDVTAQQLTAGIIDALLRCSNEDLIGNCGAPFDTYQIEGV